MTKTQLIEKAAKDSGLSKKSVTEAYDAINAAFLAALAEGEAVQIAGFGSFTVKTRAARTGRNPRTGAEIKVPASKYVAFSAGKALKDKVN